MKKLNRKSVSPPPSPFKKTCPCTILPPPLFNFSDSPSLEVVIKIYPPLPPSIKKRGGPNYVDLYMSFYEKREIITETSKYLIHENLKCQHFFLFLKKQPQFFFPFFTLYSKSPFQYHKVRHLNFLLYITSWNWFWNFSWKRTVSS